MTYGNREKIGAGKNQQQPEVLISSFRYKVDEQAGKKRRKKKYEEFDQHERFYGL